jgi:hypothetical protein
MIFLYQTVLKNTEEDFKTSRIWTSLGNPIYILTIKPLSIEKWSRILPSIIYLCKSPCFLAIPGNLILEFYPNQSLVVSFEPLSTIWIGKRFEIILPFCLAMDNFGRLETRLCSVYSNHHNWSRFKWDNTQLIWIKF